MKTISVNRPKVGNQTQFNMTPKDKTFRDIYLFQVTNRIKLQKKLLYLSCKDKISKYAKKYFDKTPNLS